MSRKFFSSLIINNSKQLTILIMSDLLISKDASKSGWMRRTFLLIDCPLKITVSLNIQEQFDQGKNKIKTLKPFPEPPALPEKINMNDPRERENWKKEKEQTSRLFSQEQVRSRKNFTKLISLWTFTTSPSIRKAVKTGNDSYYSTKCALYEKRGDMNSQTVIYFSRTTSSFTKKRKKKLISAFLSPVSDPYIELGHDLQTWNS